MRGEQEHRVGRREVGRGQVGRVAGRGRGHRRIDGLALVVDRERPAAAPAGEDDLLVAEPLARVADRRGEIERDLLHDQRRVVAPVAAVGVDDVVAGAGERSHERQVGAAADWVHEQQYDVGLHADRDELVGLEEDVPLLTAVGVLERRLLAVADPERPAVDVEGLHRGGQ